MNNVVFKRERGVALITVILVSALVLGLFAMTFTNILIGNTLVSTNQDVRIGAECGYGDVELAAQIVEMLIEGEPVEELLEGVTIHEDTEEEINRGDVLENTLVNDPTDDVGVPGAVPDITIDSSLPGCPRVETTVDVDFVYTRLNEEGESSTGEAYHHAVGGAVCPTGRAVYALTVLTETDEGTSRVQSAYAACI